MGVISNAFVRASLEIGLRQAVLEIQNMGFDLRIHDDVVMDGAALTLTERPERPALPAPVVPQGSGLRSQASQEGGAAKKVPEGTDKKTRQAFHVRNWNLRKQKRPELTFAQFLAYRSALTKSAGG